MGKKKYSFAEKKQYHEKRVKTYASNADNAGISWRQSLYSQKWLNGASYVDVGDRHIDGWKEDVEGFQSAVKLAKMCGDEKRATSLQLGVVERRGLINGFLSAKKDKRS